MFGFGAARFALGFGEAGNFPAAVKAVAEWFPRRERALGTEKFQSADEVRRYVETLFGRLTLYTHRFMLTASCNTSIRTPWKILQWFRDAWREFGQ